MRSSHFANEEEAGSGNGSDLCAFCRQDIKEIKQTSRELLRLVDMHMTELIRLLSSRQDNPFQFMNRMLLVMTGAMALFVAFVFIHVYGIDATSGLIGAVKGK